MGHHDDRGGHARDDEVVCRGGPRDPQGVDLLGDGHGPICAAIGRAASRRDHEPRQHGAEFAAHRQADGPPTKRPRR